MSITGKVTVITGASGGLGPAVVSKFVALGARVATVQRSGDVVAGVGLALAEDVTDEAAVERLMAQVAEQLGPPQILLNLVGGWAGGQKIQELDLTVWQHMLELNLTSAFLCSKHALRHMLPAGYGRIVSVSSKAALDFRPGVAAYAVAKAGVIALTEALAVEVKGTGVAASCVLPSVIDTPATRASMPKADPAKWVTPGQIAEALAWLASDEGGAANGAIVPLYGAV